MLALPLMLLCSPEIQEPVPQAPPPERWTTSLSTYWIEPPHGDGYLSAVLGADRGPLHLEAHWAYEDRDTASLFVGRTFPIGGDFAGTVTPRIGYASGDSDGIVPALNLEVGWKRLSFNTDIEYMIGTSNETQDFLYSWSELALSVNERISVGLVAQRTNIFEQELTVDRGFLVGVNLGRTWLTAYWFNPELDDPYFTVAFGAGF